MYMGGGDYDDFYFFRYIFLEAHPDGLSEIFLPLPVIRYPANHDKNHDPPFFCYHTTIPFTTQTPVLQNIFFIIPCLLVRKVLMYYLMQTYASDNQRWIIWQAVCTRQQGAMETLDTYLPDLTVDLTEPMPRRCATLSKD